MSAEPRYNSIGLVCWYTSALRRIVVTMIRDWLKEASSPVLHDTSNSNAWLGPRTQYVARSTRLVLEMQWFDLRSSERAQRHSQLVSKAIIFLGADRTSKSDKRHKSLLGVLNTPGGTSDFSSSVLACIRSLASRTFFFPEGVVVRRC